jgi:hypothetical protein
MPAFPKRFGFPREVLQNLFGVLRARLKVALPIENDPCCLRWACLRNRVNAVNILRSCSLDDRFSGLREAGQKNDERCELKEHESMRRHGNHNSVCKSGPKCSIAVTGADD